jgi:predicted enzyme related to lactoylglutathione lyase
VRIQNLHQIGLAAALLVPGVSAPAVEPSPPTLGDLSFMAGSWRATHDGSRLEEHFTPPSDGSMIGMFRWSSDAGTQMTEHVVIEQRDDGVLLFLRHFDPGAVAWEREQAGGPMIYTLDTVAEGRAVFVADRSFPRRIVYHRVGPDRMIVRLEGRRDSGEPRVLEFQYRSISMTTSTTLTEAGLSLGYDGGLTVAFQVTDLQKSIDWYQNNLGFKLAYRLEEMGWCELTTSVERVNIGLSQVETVKAGGPTPTFGVKDIEHARSQLESSGVRFDGDTIEIPQMVKLATFFDPDGNSLMLYQMLGDSTP